MFSGDAKTCPNVLTKVENESPYSWEGGEGGDQFFDEDDDDDDDGQELQQLKIRSPIPTQEGYLQEQAHLDELRGYNVRN